MAQAKKKLKFFDVEISTLGKTTQLLAYEIKELEGKIIRYDLTRVLKGKNALLDVKVKVENDVAKTFPISLQLLPTFIRRMMRKTTDYVEDSFVAKTKNSEIRIKPLLITRRRVARKVLKGLREKTKEELIKYSKTRTTELIFDDILRNKLQKELSLKLKKIYPLSLCEIRTIEVIGKKEQ